MTHLVKFVAVLLLLSICGIKQGLPRVIQELQTSVNETEVDFLQDEEEFDDDETRQNQVLFIIQLSLQNWH